MKNVMADMGIAPALTGPAKAAQQSAESAADNRMHSVSGEEQGHNPRATRAPLQARSGVPAGSETSGMERAMSEHADKVHPVGRRK